MNNIIYQPIGIVHSPFKTAQGTPIQPLADCDTEACIEIYNEYLDGLLDLEQFSHIYVLFHLHLAQPKGLRVIPFLDTQTHGIFATRSPGRPNPIGLSVVKLCRIEGNMLYIKNMDLLDGSPIIDIKPYIPQFDIHQTTQNGWFDKNIHKMNQQKDDGRFV